MMKDQRLKTVFECALPGILTLLIFTGVLIFKGIFPFGKNLIDYYDMGQTNAPLYYHIWDFLHGRSALFFDWYIDLSQNLSMGSAIQWNISPFNLYFLLIPRGLVYRSLSVYMGLHLFFMAFNMAVFLKYLCQRIPYHFLVAGAISYGLCGFTLTHYTIPTYLDTAAFFPLFALALFRLLRGRGRIMYMLMLGFMTALSYYLGFMHLIYVLLFSGVYIFLIIEDSKIRKKAAADLALGTVAGILLSSVIFIPSVMQMTSSSRFNSNLSDGPFETLVSILNSTGADEYYVKYLQLYAMEIFIAIIILYALNYRREWKRTAAILLSVFIPCSLIVFESVNILWHFGTYYHYPIRCGYLIPFALISGAAVSYEKLCSEGEEKKQIKKLPKKVYLTVSVISAIALTVLLSFYFSHKEWDIKVLFDFWGIMAFITFIIIILSVTVITLLLRKTGEGGSYITHTAPVIVRAFLPVLIAELILGGVIGYGKPHFRDTFFGDPEQSGDYIPKAEALKEALNDYFHEEEASYRINRLKNADTELNTNYGMVIRHGTITGWANTVSREALTSAEKLGYSTHFMRILDSGGTFLTDSILQVKDVVDYSGHMEEAGDIYRNMGEYSTSEGNFTLFHNKCAFPFAMPVTEDIDTLRLEENSIAENNNCLYKLLSEDSEDIASVIKVSEAFRREEPDKAAKDGKAGSGSAEPLQSSPADGEEGPLQGKVKISGKKALYLSKGKGEEIKVNGKTVYIPTIGDMDNTSYPGWFNSNLIFLGIFEDETVKLSCPGKSRLISFDIEKFIFLSKTLQKRSEESGERLPEATKSGISFEISGDETRNRALIPLAFSPGWSAFVNGEKAKLWDLSGLFMTVPIKEGMNTVELTFTPPGLKAGLIIEIMTILIIAAFALSRKAARTGNALLSHLENLIYPLFSAAFILFALSLCIIPIIWTLIHALVRRI